MITKKYETNDIVKILPHTPELKLIHGKKGIIHGISVNEEDPTIIAYSVYMPSLKESWFVFEKDLEDTGKKADSDLFETGMSITITTDK